MSIGVTERRQIENEMIFRGDNEKVGTELDEIDAMHVQDGNLDLVRDDGTVLHFKCECADENCNARVPIKLSVYQKIHVNRDSFIIKLKHQVQAIETILISEQDYCVVHKNNSTPEPTGGLNTTTINNT